MTATVGYLLIGWVAGIATAFGSAVGLDYWWQRRVDRQDGE